MKKEIGCSEPSYTKSIPINKYYLELLEQVLLMRKQLVMVHEQLARIESKLDSNLSRQNARVLLR